MFWFCSPGEGLVVWYLCLVRRGITPGAEGMVGSFYAGPASTLLLGRFVGLRPADWITCEWSFGGVGWDGVVGFTSYFVAIALLL